MNEEKLKQVLIKLRFLNEKPTKKIINFFLNGGIEREYLQKEIRESTGIKSWATLDRIIKGLYDLGVLKYSLIEERGQKRKAYFLLSANLKDIEYQINDLLEIIAINVLEEENSN